MVLQDGFCRKCGEEYTDMRQKWCKPCQIDKLKVNFTNWTCGNEKIDNFIQEMRLKIDDLYDTISYLNINKLKHTKLMNNKIIFLLQMEYLRIQSQKIILWFLMMDFVENVVKNTNAINGVNHVK